MRQQPTVSIITPTYNRAYVLGNAIDSVIKQSYKDWELIIIDDGSADKPKELVQTFSDERIKYIYQKNAGPSAARNKGLSMARGSWIAYLDSDNELYPNYLQVMFNWIRKNPRTLYTLPKVHKTLDLVKNGKTVKSIDVSDEDYPEKVTVKDIFRRKIHFDGNGFIHSRRITEEGIFWDENLMRMEEWEFAMRIANDFPNAFLYIPVVLMDYHQRFGGDGLVSNTTYEEWAEAFEHIYQKVRNFKLLEGQKWYPDRVKKYQQLAKDYKEGKAPAPYMRYFV